MNLTEAQSHLKPGAQLEKEIRVRIGRATYFIEIDEIAIRDGKAFAVAIVKRSVKDDRKPRNENKTKTAKK